jgi:two-component sensor histidine kinase
MGNSTGSPGSSDSAMDPGYQYLAILDSIPDMVLAFDSHGYVTYTNDSFRKKTGFSVDVDERIHLSNLISRDTCDVIFQKFGKQGRPGEVSEDVSLNIAGDGLRPATLNGKLHSSPRHSTYPFHFMVLRDGAGEKTVASHDEEMLRAVREKEILLREVHHRVKNNLQIISSLLNLQSLNVKDESDRQLFIESKNRVHTMALAHEKLYLSENSFFVSFESYIRGIIDDIVRSYGGNRDIEVAISAVDVVLNVDRAMPAALIINELVSNAFKYAFPSGGKGAVSVSCRCAGEGFELRVHDNGCGFPEGLDYRTTESLGLQLVNSLASQLKGSITMTSDTRGTEFIVTF